MWEEAAAKETSARAPADSYRVMAEGEADIQFCQGPGLLSSSPDRAAEEGAATTLPLPLADKADQAAVLRERKAGLPFLRWAAAAAPQVLEVQRGQVVRT